MKTVSEAAGTFIGVLVLVVMLSGLTGAVVWALAAVTGNTYGAGWKVASELIKWTSLAVLCVGVGGYYLVRTYQLTKGD